MATEDAPKSAKPTKEEFDIIQNRIQLALSKRENLIKSWTASSSRKEPTKTQAELDAEDAALFRNEPPYLGVGAPIPSHFLVSDAERNNKSLRAKFFPGKGLKGSKPRDEDEKAASVKRGLNEESSDEEGGRSSLGKAKKLKTTKTTPAPVQEEIKARANDDEIALEVEDEEKSGITEEARVETSLATPPETPVKNTITRENRAKEMIKDTEESGRAADTTKVPQVQEQAQKQKEQEKLLSKPVKPIGKAKQVKLQKKKEKQKLKTKMLKDQKQKELIAKLAVDTLEWLDDEHVDTEQQLEQEVQDQVQD